MEQNIVLKALGLHKTFGKRPIIQNVSFDVYEGEIFGFLGPNGSGKTTTIKMLLGLLDIDQGQVVIGGYDRVRQFEKALACIGGIIENPDTYPYLTGYKNLEVYGRLRGNIDKARIDEVVRLVGLENRIHEKVRTYSLGMKQRLGVAQAILHHPKVLVLDEPTNGLDPSGIHELRDTLKYLARQENIAVFVSSHILSEMELLCDRVCIINAGRVLQTQQISELTEGLADSTVYLLLLRGAQPEQIICSLGERYLAHEADTYTVRAEEAEIPTLLSDLMRASIQVYGVQQKIHSLEESFLEITGGGNTVV